MKPSRILVALFAVLVLAQSLALDASAAQRRGRAAKRPAPAAARVTPPAATPLRTDIPQLGPSAFGGFPVGASVPVDLTVDTGGFADLTRRERVDQVRDWLLYAVVSDSGLPSDAVAQCLYDVPTTRRSFVHAIANFEYGAQRSCYVGNGNVVVLLPPATEAERADVLRSVADEHRKNTGAPPTTLHVFQCDVNLAGEFATVTRLAPVDARTLFTPAAGYVEAAIASADDLRRFLGQVDDVTYATMAGGALRLGGRKVADHAYLGVGYEDIAAIWQSESKIQAKENDYEERAQPLFDAFDRKWQAAGEAVVNQFLSASLNARTAAARKKAVQDFEQAKQKYLADKAADEDIVRKKLVEIFKTYGTVSGSGFSLDPHYDYAALAAFIEKLEPEIKAAAVTDSSGGIAQLLASAREGAAKEDAIPFLRLVERLKASEGADVRKLGYRVQHDTSSVQYQAARYDGDLQGTEVGMTLFYTDLLCKLWSFNIADSSPDSAIDGFVTEPRRILPPMYRQELTELPNTRMWFGPRTRGFQISDKGQTLALGRNAARLYAASSDPLQPGREVAANAPSAAFLTWWDDHYEEVARHEPQYERLNEIMKWSLVIGWLNDAGKGDALGFLADAQVARGNWFPEWVSHRSGLQFDTWKSVGFHERGYKGVPTETMPLLNSEDFRWFSDENDANWYLEGGVSLAGKRLLGERRAIAAGFEEAPQIVRRPNVSYDAVDAANGRLRTLEGVEYSVKHVSPEVVGIDAVAPETAKLRGVTGEFAKGTAIDREFVRRAGGMRVETKVAGSHLGDLEIAKKGNGFSVGWRARDVDTAHELARWISYDGTFRNPLSAEAAVEKVFLVPDEAFFVKLRGSERWAKFNLEDVPMADVAPGWASRVSYDKGSGLNVVVGWADEAQVVATIRKQPVLSIDLGQSGSAGLRVDVPDGGIPATARPVTIESGGTAFAAHVDAETGLLYVRASELPPAIRQDPTRLADLLPKAELEGLADYVGESGGGPLRYRVVGADGPEGGLARDLSFVDNLLSSGTGSDALHHLDLLAAKYGEQPELSLRRALADIVRNRPDEAKALVDDVVRSGRVDAPSFLDELNARLRDYPADGEALFFESDGGLPTFSFRMKGAPSAAAVDPSRIDLANSTIYIQDAPGLNTIDWNASLDKSLRSVVSGDLGTVVELPREEIARYRPAKIYTAEDGSAFKAARSSNGLSAPSLRGWYVPCSNEDDASETGERKEPCAHRVYLVVARQKQ